jgi:hypothetical protein
MIDNLEDLTAHVLAHGLRFKQSDVDLPDAFYWLWKMNAVRIIEIDTNPNIKAWWVNPNPDPDLEQITFMVQETLWYHYDVHDLLSDTAYVAGIIMELNYNKYNKRYIEMKQAWARSNP